MVVYAKIQNIKSATFLNTIMSEDMQNKNGGGKKLKIYIIITATNASMVAFPFAIGEKFYL